MGFERFELALRNAGVRGVRGWIIAISGILLVVQHFSRGWLVPYFGLVPSQVTEHYWLWQPFTYLFLHGGIFHWLLNMFFLWMFGVQLESRWGSWEFLKFFFICGAGSGLLAIALTPHSGVPIIGASGAVFGLIVAFTMIAPHATMYMYFLFPMKAWHAAILFAALEFFGGRYVHLGGMAVGYVYLRYWSGFKIQAKGWFRSWKPSRNSPVELHEVTDELVQRVDRILEKVLKEGVDSLTREEKEIMDRYAKTKR